MSNEPPKFKGCPFPGFLLEKYLLKLPPHERPAAIKRVEQAARETLDFEMMRCVKDYRDLCRDPTVKF